MTRAERQPWMEACVRQSCLNLYRFPTQPIAHKVLDLDARERHLWEGQVERHVAGEEGSLRSLAGQFLREKVRLFWLIIWTERGPMLTEELAAWYITRGPGLSSTEAHAALSVPEALRRAREKGQQVVGVLEVCEEKGFTEQDTRTVTIFHINE